jgi:hypothetical protein
MYPSVRNVVTNDDFTLVVTFDNDEEGILDMKPYLGIGVFRKIAEIEKFRTAKVSFDTIEWCDGVDLDPEFVYSKCETAVKV